MQDWSCVLGSRTCRNGEIRTANSCGYSMLAVVQSTNMCKSRLIMQQEISKSNVVDDMVASNAILYDKGEYPDHVVVIKYVPHVGDSKRAMDEYSSEIFLGGRSVIAIHNTCEDSLLAAPIILDLVLIAELLTRIKVKKVWRH